MEGAHQLQEVELLLHDDRLVPILEQMAPTVGAIAGPGLVLQGYVASGVEER